MNWAAKLRPFVPPIALAAYRRLRASHAIRFTGDHPDWASALDDSQGFDCAAILERVRESALKVLDGTAAFERDGVAFAEPEHNYPLLACLLRAATASGNRLRVLDFGGSLGSTYFQCRPFLAGILELTWTVVEQPHFVECGRRGFANERLKFRPSIEEVESPVDVVLLSGVLPYMSEPHSLLDRLAAIRTRWLILDRTFTIPGGRDVLTIQRVPPAIYGEPISYPAWLLSRDRLLEQCGRQGRLVCEADGSDGPFSWPGGVISGRFWCFEREAA